jgi:hypothetical protein
MNPGGGPIQINVGQLEANIRAAEAELALWRARLDAMIERGRQESLHIRGFCESQGYKVAHPYLMAIKADYEAQGNMIQLQIAKLEGQVMTMKAMLEEAKKSVIVPGAFK